MSTPRQHAAPLLFSLSSSLILTNDFMNSCLSLHCFLNLCFRQHHRSAASRLLFCHLFIFRLFFSIHVCSVLFSFRTLIVSFSFLLYFINIILSIFISNFHSWFFIKTAHLPNLFSQDLEWKAYFPGR